MYMPVDEPPYRNVWLKFDPKRLKLFLPLPPYSQKQFIVHLFSNLCYPVKEGWEVRGPGRGLVSPVAGATTPLLGMGVLYSAYSVSFNECVRLERSLPAGDQRVALPSRCDVPLHLQDENWMYTNVNGREPFMTVHAWRLREREKERNPSSFLSCWNECICLYF